MREVFGCAQSVWTCAKYLHARAIFALARNVSKRAGNACACVCVCVCVQKVRMHATLTHAQKLCMCAALLHARVCARNVHTRAKRVCVCVCAKCVHAHEMFACDHACELSACAGCLHLHGMCIWI